MIQEEGSQARKCRHIRGEANGSAVSNKNTDDLSRRQKISSSRSVSQDKSSPSEDDKLLKLVTFRCRPIKPRDKENESIEYHSDRTQLVFDLKYIFKKEIPSPVIHAQLRDRLMAIFPKK